MFKDYYSIPDFGQLVEYNLVRREINIWSSGLQSSQSGGGARQLKGYLSEISVTTGGLQKSLILGRYREKVLQSFPKDPGHH